MENNELDTEFKNRPKAFKKFLNKHIRDNTLLYMQQFGRGKWVTVNELFEETLEKTDLFNSRIGNLSFSIKGVNAKINWATHELRRLGYPIISGKKFYNNKYGKGYILADEECDGFIDYWDEKRNAFEERKENLKKERESDIKLIQRIIERLKEKKRLEEAQKLQEIIIKYNQKQIQEEEE